QPHPTPRLPGRPLGGCPGRRMSIASTHFEAAVESLSRRIVDAEMRSTAAAEALAALTKTEADTIEAQRQLWEEMDALLALRQELWELRSSKGT
ncbi:hypothetical protein, partial [Heyndrickxia sporothermodurans]